MDGLSRRYDGLLTVKLSFCGRTQRVLVPADGTTDAIFEAAEQRWAEHGELCADLLLQPLTSSSAPHLLIMLPGPASGQDTQPARDPAPEGAAARADDAP